MFKAVIFRKSWCWEGTQLLLSKQFSGVLHEIGVRASRCFKPALSAFRDSVDEGFIGSFFFGLAVLAREGTDPAERCPGSHLSCAVRGQIHLLGVFGEQEQTAAQARGLFPAPLRCSTGDT